MTDKSLTSSQAIRALGLAGAYYLSAKLALLLAIPPGYATAVWPAAGISLAAVLLYGRGVWPGILLGSFLANVGTGLDASNGAALLRSLLLPAALALGAVLHALAGAALIRRFVGFPHPLDEEWAVGKFLALGGPVACVLSATVGATSLALAGAILPADFLFNWWTWWIGDSIGVLLFTPLVLFAAAEPRSIWRARGRQIGLPLGIVFLLVLGMFIRASAWEQERVESVFKQSGAAASEAVQASLFRYLEVLYSLQDFDRGTPRWGRREFLAFLRGPLARNPEIQGFSWDPVVPNAQRGAFEAAARREGYAGYRIRERGPDGRLVAAQARDEYVPVLYLAPDLGNTPALGFDIASDPARREALSRARATGRLAASARLKLVQLPGPQAGLLIYAPVFRSGSPPGTGADRRREVKGYMAAVFGVTSILDDFLRPLEQQGIDVHVCDETNPGQADLLYASHDPHGIEPSCTLAPAGMQWDTSLAFAGRHWRLRFLPTPAYMAAHRDWQAWLFLARGLLFTGLLGAFLLVVTGKASNVEMQVRLRTAELADLNTVLQEEVSQRRQAQEALQQSEARARLMFAMTSDALVLTELGQVTDVNPSFEEIFGYARAEIIGQSWLELFAPASHTRITAYTQDQPQAPLAVEGLRKDGSLVALEYLSRGALDDGRPIRILTLRDVSARREVERLKDEFTAMLVHDLRSPLTSVLGFTEVLNRPDFILSTEQVRQFATYANDSAQRMLLLVNDIMDLARLETGKIHLDLGSVQPVELLEKVLAEVRPLAEARRLRLTVEWPAGLPRLQADARRLHQVLVNLLNNATKFARAQVFVRAAKQDGELEISVEDDGPGIPPEEQALLFDKWQQTKTGRAFGKGSGLGLAIARLLVEAHGGRLVVQSTTGQGSIFRCMLPLVGPDIHS